MRRVKGGSRLDPAPRKNGPIMDSAKLLWMCDKIEDHAEDHPATKLHRWIGFIYCGMMAHRLLNLRQALNGLSLNERCPSPVGPIQTLLLCEGI